VRKRQLQTALWAWVVVWCVVFVALRGSSDAVHHTIWFVGFGPFYVAALVMVYQWVGARLAH
jgi:hypothetical protein